MRDASSGVCMQKRRIPWSTWRKIPRTRRYRGKERGEMRPLITTTGMPRLPQARMKFGQISVSVSSTARGESLFSAARTAQPKSRGKKTNCSAGRRCSATARPVSVTVDTSRGRSGQRALRSRASGVAAITSPTETACSQRGGTAPGHAGTRPRRWSIPRRYFPRRIACAAKTGRPPMKNARQSEAVEPVHHALKCVRQLALRRSHSGSRFTIPNPLRKIDCQFRTRTAERSQPLAARASASAISASNRSARTDWSFSTASLSASPGT